MVLAVCIARDKKKPKKKRMVQSVKRLVMFSELPTFNCLQQKTPYNLYLTDNLENYLHHIYTFRKNAQVS